jgi:NhaA family Na+:H+ antiporter
VQKLGLSWSLLAAGGLLTGIGFTMSLFIAGLAYGPAMLTAAKIGILCGSAVSAAAGFIMLIWLTSRRKTA